MFGRLKKWLVYFRKPFKCSIGWSQIQLPKDNYDAV